MSVVQTLLLTTLLLLGFGSHAEALDAWLDKMKQAMNSENYEGTLVIRQQDRMQAMRIKHGVGEQGSWETLESLSGEARKVIRKDGQVTTIFPDRGLMTISRDGPAASLRPRLPENSDILKDYYQLDLVGEDRVASKPTQVVQVRPRDEYRYGFKFWLDKDSGLLLKCDLLDQQGRVIEQLMFSELSMLERPPVLDNQVVAREDYQVIDLDEGQVGPTSHQWRVDRLPGGFALTQSRSRPSRHGEGLVHHMVFSDGLASVSVFVENQMPENRVLNGVSSMGALSAYGQATDGHHVTVIGEVPVATVQLIGQSIHQKPGETSNHD
jgi:sigma-E factor negative regulatory protein RseB